VFTVGLPSSGRTFFILPLTLSLRGNPMECRSWRNGYRPESVSDARELACRVLAGNPERIRHSAGVATRAASLARAVPDTAVGVLVAAAWVHDIGYALALRNTAFHPLDGALFLRSIGWEPLLCDLVAHHSGSRFVAAANGLEAALADFEFIEDPLSDALTVADQTVGPNGVPLSVEDRLLDMLDRHGSDSPNARAHPRRQAYIRAAFERVSSRMKADHADLSVLV
jgi:hypothetical protein